MHNRYYPNLILSALLLVAFALPNSAFAAVAFQSANNTSGSGASIAITKPTGLAAGDLMVAYIVAMTDAGDGGSNPPAGWSTKTSRTNTFGHDYIFWKIADSGDAAATNFTFTQTGSSAKSILGVLSRITGTDQTAPLDQTNSNSNVGGSTLSPGAITPSSANTVVMLFAGGWNGGGARTYSGYAFTNNNPTWTEDVDAAGPAFAGASPSFAQAHGSYSPATTIGSASITASGTFSDVADSFVLDIVAPAAAAATPVVGLVNAWWGY